MSSFNPECDCEACKLTRAINEDSHVKAMRSLLKYNRRKYTKAEINEIKHFINVRKLEIIRRYL